VALTDAMAALLHLFASKGLLSCPDAADTDDDGGVSLTDAIFLLLHLFAGGPAPPLPGPGSCGVDPTPDELAGCVPDCS